MEQTDEKVKDKTSVGSHDAASSNLSDVACHSETVTESLRIIFERIADSKIVVKTQQRGDPDLSKEERFKILTDIYKKNNVTFLYRFGKYLKLEELKLFSDSSNSYDHDFYIEKLRKSLNPDNKARTIRNRRYNYLKTVLRNTDYFSEKELEKRDPLLYKQYVKQYQTKAEHTEETESNLASQSFSQFLFGTIDRDLNNFRCEIDHEIQQNQEEEEESDEELEQDEDFKKYLDGKVPLSKEDRDLFHGEFVELMENRFLNGEDDFDYSIVDNNDVYDDYMDQDMEDKYFDED